jgi:uncharacterized protein YbcC (UPF0753/DUF2309 family)
MGIPQPILLKYLHGIAALSWTGYINHRTTYHSEWQQEYPITLEDYLAVRLWVAKEIDAEIYRKIMILQPSHRYRSYNTFG